MSARVSSRLSLFTLLVPLVLGASCGGASPGDADATGEGDGYSFNELDWGSTGGDTGPRGPDGDDDGVPADPDATDPDGVTGPDGEGPGPDGVTGGHQIRIVAPTDMEQVSGPIRVRIEPVDVEEWEPEAVLLTLNGEQIFSDVKLPTELIIDTNQYADGAMALKATAYDADGEYPHEIGVQVDNPGFRLEAVEPHAFLVANGEALHVTVEAMVPGLTVVADFSAIDGLFTPGAETTQDNGDGSYLISWTISAGNNNADGFYPIPVTITDPGTGESLLYNLLRVKLENDPVLPLRVDGGIFVDAAPPAPSGTIQPITLLFGNDFIITGGSSKLNVDFQGYVYASEIIGLVVYAQGFQGYYQKPLEGSNGDEELLLLLRPFLDTESPPTKLDVRVAAVDKTGAVYPYQQKTLSVESVGSGDIQVSISWDTGTDVDLHVVEPTGCELYYGNDSCPSGGWLDLDSNPACSMDWINNENTFWPEGQAPVGTYTVRVDFWEDCWGDGANYTVTIHNCGEVETVDGSFAPWDDDMGGPGDGVTVATFSNESCGRLLRGRVRYEDRAFDRWGFRARSWRPSRHAQVELYAASTDTLLGTAWTDRFGRYELTYNSPPSPGVYLKLRTRTNESNGLRDLRLYNHPKFKQVYTVKTENFDEHLVDWPVHDVNISEADFAGAFNIFDTLVGGHDLVRLMTGRDLGLLEAYWATGADTTDTLYCSQAIYDGGLCTEKGALSIQGKDTDRDEYDDMVILKEFFKLILDRVSKDSHPGGVHHWTRDLPTRAWTDGVATFFACTAMETRWYVNSRPAGVYLVLDAEEPDSPFAAETSTGDLFGDLSGALVTALLWDLADAPLAPEDWDAVDGMSRGIFDAVFNYFPRPDFPDRGVEGVDLVDFLDGWVCRGWGAHPAIQASTDHYGFPYDFAPPIDCAH